MLRKQLDEEWREEADTLWPQCRQSLKWKRSFILKAASDQLPQSPHNPCLDVYPCTISLHRMRGRLVSYFQPQKLIQVSQHQIILGDPTGWGANYNIERLLIERPSLRRFSIAVSFKFPLPLSSHSHISSWYLDSHYSSHISKGMWDRHLTSTVLVSRRRILSPARRPKHLYPFLFF